MPPVGVLGSVKVSMLPRSMASTAHRAVGSSRRERAVAEPVVEP